MSHTETIQEFYQRVPQANATGLALNNAGVGHFNVFTRASCFHKTPYIRRDFYKVSLIIGTGKLYYADKWIAIDRPALLFSNPVIPYSWEATSEEQEGWFCLFTDAFVHHYERKESLAESPLFKIGGNPIFFINEQQQQELSRIFQKMMVEIASTYTHKYDLLRNYLHLVIHEAMKMQPAESFEKHANASARITSLFIELLERQFPIDTPEDALQLKTATDYAKQLSVHVNHLNRSVKEITGKTTTEHISARITKEAQALLKHTDWNIAEIAYSLGFEYPTYFNLFFKKQTRLTPNEARSVIV
ncbi:helix-turn-helix domain-containing protein [Spirosoma sp. HMF4905]|uniref:Helix-turn-helix domain-containing protein n=1 Tax=Spirosoma arboris TaxID=2682092 RepID=A0A7K1SBR0_9BACT|nr:helix-turn-helix domain-containing protein [Spirosoma arboris]MVM31253.1 helix-turn-helix domain-containing protein [Spirosoma arboris]